MKRLMLCLAASLCLLCSCGRGYVIDGTISQEEGAVMLLSPIWGDSMDTLATAPVTGGRFCLRGRVGEPALAFLVWDEGRARQALFLENCAYTVLPDSLVGADICRLQVCGGGPLQEAFAAYGTLLGGFARQTDSLRGEYRAARARDDVFWSLHVRALMEDVDSLREAVEDSFLLAQNNLVAAGIVYQRLPELRKQKRLHGKYDCLGPEARASLPGRLVAEALREVADTRVGALVQDFALPTPQGEALAHYALEAKIVIIDLWASWCNPCRAEFPHLRELYSRYHSLGLEILGVSLDTQEDKWALALEQEQLPWPQVSDLKGFEGPVPRRFGVRVIPYMLVLDAGHHILAVNPGREDLSALLQSRLFSATADK